MHIDLESRIFDTSHFQDRGHDNRQLLAKIHYISFSVASL